MTDPRNIDDHRIEPLAAAMADLPQAYPDIEYQLAAISNELRRRFAAALEAPLNDFLAAQQPRALVACRRLARMVDDATSHLGLCVMVGGREGVPCATELAPGRRAGFAVMVRADTGRRLVKHPLDADRPQFTLAVAPPNIDAYLSPIREKVYPRGLAR